MTNFQTRKPVTRLALIGAALLAIASCSNANDAKAQNDEAEKPAAMANYEALAVPSGSYTMDKDHGYVTFSYSHFGLSNPQLRFRDIDAILSLDADKPETSVLTVMIDAASIDSGVDEFDGHLNSPGWFDTAKYGKISFTSTSFTRADAATGTMTGDLTMMGVTKPLTLDVTLLAAKPHPVKKVPAIGIEARGTLKRSDFGLGKYAPGVTDDVDILVSAEFHKDK